MIVWFRWVACLCSTETYDAVEWFGRFPMESESYIDNVWCTVDAEALPEGDHNK